MKYMTCSVATSINKHLNRGEEEVRWLTHELLPYSAYAVDSFCHTLTATSVGTPVQVLGNINI